MEQIDTIAISFGDNVRVLTTPTTTARGCAGRVGMVYGETTPSITGVAVVGGVEGDYAINVQLDGETEALWFAPELLEFVDHAPGTAMVIGGKRFVRTASGEWAEWKTVE